MPQQSSRDQPAPARIRERPTWLVSRAYVRSRRLLTEGFDAEGDGLRSYHYRLLAALEESGPIGQADLGRRTGLDRSDVVALLAELERGGLAERTVNPENRRRNIVTITRAGSRQLRRLDGLIDGIQERFLAPLTERERLQFTRLLHKLADAD
jgi:MarR family transcriptional regulator, lower aerobic nicotinate degradation pathway regulator